MFPPVPVPAVPVPAVPRPGPVAEHIYPGALPGYVSCDADAPGAESAQVQVAKGKLVLSFCAHHFRRHELDLAAAGWVITNDSREWAP